MLAHPTRPSGMTTTTFRRTPKALLLDDDTTVLRLLGTALEARGFEELPGRDARSLLHLVRWAGGEQELGVVVLAGTLDDASRDQLLALGADAVLDRRAGLAAALEAIAAVALRAHAPAGRTAERARPALRGDLLLAA